MNFTSNKNTPSYIFITQSTDVTFNNVNIINNIPYAWENGILFSENKEKSVCVRIYDVQAKWFKRFFTNNNKTDIVRRKSLGL